MKVKLPTLPGKKPEEIIGVVVPMFEGATMSPSHFLTVYLSEPYRGEHFRMTPIGKVKSISRNYVKEKL